MLHDIEISGSAEPGRKVTAFGAVVQVVHGRFHMLNIGVDRIAEYHSLEHGDQEYDQAHPRVAEDLDEFLDQH
jgi:hypothetical protein